MSNVLKIRNEFSETLTMRTRHLKRTTHIRQPIESVFDFFADAGNLGKITPDWLQFEILTPGPISMATGTMIDYRIRLRGLPMRWRSEITLWEPPYRFVDEQRRGPYRSWIHEHRFVQRESGTDVIDEVRYSVHGGWLIEKLFVDRDLERIFDSRQERLAELLPPMPQPSAFVTTDAMSSLPRAGALR